MTGAAGAIRAVGLLHPGAMGATVGGACRVDTWWVPADRSGATTARAAEHGLRAAGSLAELVERCDVIVSVCPPAAAPDVAAEVADAGFDGIYVEANAIAPATTRAIAARFDRFVDGGIVGPPAMRAGTTRLYLAGHESTSVAALWDGSLLEARVLDGPVGAASALKMAYATWTKVSTALLLDVRALARVEGVEAALLAEWELSQPGTAERSERSATGVAPKAWRFVGEMEQIAATFRDDDLPAGFAEGAIELYTRLAGLQDTDGATLDEVLDLITRD